MPDCMIARAHSAQGNQLQTMVAPLREIPAFAAA